MPVSSLKCFFDTLWLQIQEFMVFFFIPRWNVAGSQSFIEYMICVANSCFNFKLKLFRQVFCGHNFDFLKHFANFMLNPVYSETKTVDTNVCLNALRYTVTTNNVVDSFWTKNERIKVIIRKSSLRNLVASLNDSFSQHSHNLGLNIGLGIRFHSFIWVRCNLCGVFGGFFSCLRYDRLIRPLLNLRANRDLSVNMICCQVCYLQRHLARAH